MTIMDKKEMLQTLISPMLEDELDAMIDYAQHLKLVREAQGI